MDISKQLFKPQVDYHNLQGKQEKLSTSGRQNEEINKEHRDTLNIYYYKILFYSAAAFSFTLALIGLVVENRIEALAKTAVLIPNVFWLYASWISFLLASISALISRKLDAYYIANFGMARYTEAYKNYVTEEVSFVEQNPSHILMSESHEEYKKTADENLRKLTTANEENKKKEKRFYAAMRVVCVSSETLAFLGAILLVLFGILLTQAIVWP